MLRWRESCKNDLEAIPVDEMGRLVGRITIDDIIDVIRDEADQDYQLAAGISKDVEADDSILEHTKARLPWLVLALLGGFISVKVLGLFEGAMLKHGELFFSPLLQWQEMSECNHQQLLCKVWQTTP
jgi:magnesium transporter